jgi:Flp pilus assembly secretin CpaC
MRRQTVAVIVVLCAVMYAVARAGGAGGAGVGAPAAVAAPKQFVAKMRLTETRGGKSVTYAEPTLIARDGLPASYLAGGEVPVDLGKIQFIEFGTRADITIHELTADQLRVCAWFNVSTIDNSTPGSVVIPESGVRIIKTIKPGEAIEADLPGGAGRHVKVTVTPQAP